MRPTSRSDLGLGGFECLETSTRHLHLPTALPAIVLFDFVIVGEGEGVVCELQLCNLLVWSLWWHTKDGGSEISPTNVTTD